MYELYSEIVYEIINAVGRDAAIQEGREALVCYLQEAFNIDSDKHALLLEKIKERKVKQNMHKMFGFYIRNNSVNAALRHKKIMSEIQSKRSK
jgi:topoisomerase IA-like protein